MSGQIDNQIKRTKSPYKNSSSLLKFSFLNEDFSSCIYIQVRFDFSDWRQRYWWQLWKFGDKIQKSSSLSQSSYESYTEGRPGVTWHLSNRLSCLYLWALHLSVWILVFGLERLGAFALSLSDIDNSARDQRTWIIIHTI